MAGTTLRGAAAAALILTTAASTAAQSFPTDDPGIRAIWEEGMERSQVESLAQVLLDSLGPRLTGTPGSEAASDWVVRTYQSWGIDARQEPYGTWRGWDRGWTHVDLLEPRLRTLEATLLAWSPGTDGPTSGPVVTLPRIDGGQSLEGFLASVEGAWVLASPPEVTCRPAENWQEWARQSTLADLAARRSAARAEWSARLQALGIDGRALPALLDTVGAAGVLTSRWSQGWGVQKIFDSDTHTIPSLDIGCEDYGLLARLAENDQGPVLRVDARARDLGEVPVWNTIGVIAGSDRADEYVMLSAHFDSWDGGSGATDNGTGTITMMEAMRILRSVHPSPSRTIVVGHWNGEEQGLNGSRAFAADHPEIVEGLQALFNQDNGTGRVANISMQGLTAAGAFFGRWFSRLPSELVSEIDLNIPGTPGGGGSDYASFICAGAPAFGLSSLSWDYSTYTWHTNRDTFDKLAFDDVRDNAVLTAMLAYQAAEEPEMIPRDRRVMPVSPRTGDRRTWPQCRDGTRSSR